MGKWNNRSRFNRRRSPSRWYSERPSSSSSHSGYGEDDGIPVWEKRFCEVIGSVPWRKVVEATAFKSWYTGNVITWDDSACQETFHNEKKRFWSRVNGFQCDISLPDPDLYVSEVDWDTTLDPELIRELEGAYYAPPDEAKTGLKRGRRDRSWSGCSNLVPIEETQWEGSGWNAAESSSRDHLNDRTRTWEAKPSFGDEKGNDAVSGDCLTTEGWKEFEWGTKDRGNDRWGEGNDGWEQNKKAKGSESVPAEEDPWEAKVSYRKETAEDTTWGGCSGKEWDDDRGWGSDGWGKRDSVNQVMEVKEWRGTRYSQNYREPKSYSPWKADYVPENTARREYGANRGGWQTSRVSESNRREWGVKGSSDGWGRRNRERDVTCGYNSNYRNSRPVRDDYQNRKVNFSSK
ncbi:Oxidoreductase/transition metal ion-binding protein [Hirschfeldia incana]|nr:Oxidoreductase/transition metal ion-binding protein [Hirschfeldia incana]